MYPNDKYYIEVRQTSNSLLPCLDAIQNEVQNALRKNFVPNNPLLEGSCNSSINLIAQIFTTSMISILIARINLFYITY